VESSKITPWKIYKACKTGFIRQPVPSSLTLQDGSTTTSVKETANALLHKFFPDDFTEIDNGKEEHKSANNGSKVPGLPTRTKLHGT
jgi:hypothetical protein